MAGMKTRIVTEKRTLKEGAVTFAVLIEQEGNQVVLTCPDEKKAVKLASKLVNAIEHFSSQAVEKKAALVDVKV